MILVIDHDIFINFQVMFYTKFGTYVKNVFNILPLCKSTPENQNEFVKFYATMNSPLNTSKFMRYC